MLKYAEIYAPAEDSQLLLDSLKEFLDEKENLKVLEVGVGSGYISLNLAKQFKNKYFATDINPKAIEVTKENFEKENLKINLKQGNFTQPFKEEKFDLIFFNTPYLPCETGEKFEDLTLKDKAIYGGKRGCETTCDFIFQINDSLEENGVVFLLYSSLSSPKDIEQQLKRQGFEFKIVNTKAVFFEDLIVIKAWKSEILKKISKHANQICYLEKGKHSINFKANYKGKTVVIKTGKPQHIDVEAHFLKKLEKENFAPKLYYKKDGFVIREFFEGEQIKDWIKKASKEELIEVFQKVCDICFRLDELGINKDEMTNPYKHIFIEKNGEVKMIDYERCLFSDNPKNLTQFLEYLKRVFREKGLEIREERLYEFAKDYKDKKKRKQFKIKDFLSKN
ncbi:MAG: HemK2/MTQ2 family protein methyltransferase [Nanoarchaeota archaeon]